MVTDADYERLHGHALAHNLLLRGIYTNWCCDAADPLKRAGEAITGLMQTARKADPPKSDFENRVWDEIDRELSEFQTALETRLRALGHK
jgi:hypothetical protein